jgi:hypothetical protein
VLRCWDGSTRLSQHRPGGAGGGRALVLIEQQDLSQGEAAPLIGVHRQDREQLSQAHREQGEDGGRRARRPACVVAAQQGALAG